jgi:hypothetical protein
MTPDINLSLVTTTLAIINRRNNDTNVTVTERLYLHTVTPGWTLPLEYTTIGKYFCGTWNYKTLNLR